MSLLNTLKSIFTHECTIKEQPRNGKAEALNKKLDQMKEHIIQRATVDGEDEWMLVMRKHSKECK
jgi:hypothetical protein